MNKSQQPATIVQIAAYFPPHLGGLERVAEEIPRHLVLDGVPSLVLTSNIGATGYPSVEEKDGVIIKRLKSVNMAHTPLMPTLLWHLLRVPKSAIYHLHLSQVYAPEMVWLASKLRGIPYVVHFHLDVEPSGTFGFIFVWWKRWIQPIIIRGAAHIITLSPSQSTLIIERYGVPASRVTFISNGVGEKFLALGESPRELHTPLRLLFVGRLDVQKRPERLVEALSLMHSRVELALVGDGEQRSDLEALVAKLGLANVTFRGALFGDDLLEAYKQADVFVLPSDKEGMPLVALEAMATGLPIVGSDVLGITELIEGTGVLVEPTPAAFAAALDALAGDPAQLRALSQKSIAKAKEYSWVKLVAKLEEVYHRVLA